MRAFSLAPIIGIISLLLYVSNLLLGAGLVILTLFGRLIPIPAWQKLLTKAFYCIPNLWINNNNFIRKNISKTQFDVNLPNDLTIEHSYLMLSNHQSWADILVLFCLFNDRISMLKYFPKRQLLWLPIVGQLCWIYGYPFMHRLTKAQLAKHPEWKGRDLLATKKACERFKQRPGSIIIFCEGTRFTNAKREKQQSSFQYLLKPKAGGVAYALQSMEGYIKTILDVTIIYPPHQASFWQFCCGKIGKIIVDVKAIPVTDDLYGNYDDDKAFRDHFQHFINDRWSIKDKLIEETYAQQHRFD